MDTPLKSRPPLGPVPRLEARQRTAILGSLTIRGRAEEVSGARAFVTRTLSATGKGQRVDSAAPPGGRHPPLVPGARPGRAGSGALALVRPWRQR